MSRPSRIVSALVLALVTVALPAVAELPVATLPSDPTLARLIAESLSARPELALSAAVVQAEEERAAQADALPDPMLQVGIQNDGFTSIEVGRMETSFVSLMASQTLPWPGKRGLRKQLAELDTTQARHAVTRARLATEAEVRRGYWDLLLARDRLALLEQLAVLWQRSSGIARVRYETAGGAQSDVLRAQLELNRLEQRRLALEAEERARVQALNRLRARPLTEPIVTSSHILDLPALAGFDGAFSEERSVRESPELATARLARQRAERSRALAEKSYYPDVTVSVGIMYRGALPPMWLTTLGGPLPVFAGGKQSRAIAESRAWGRAAEQQVAALEQLLRWRTAERRSAFAALRKMADIYRGSLLVESQATTESTLAQYQVGKVSFASVLEANAGLIADQEGYLETVAAAYRILIAQAELSLAGPEMPSGVSGGSGAMTNSPSGSSSGAATENGRAVGDAPADM
jgi:outer membrane protein, heavy metal efflux system